MEMSRPRESAPGVQPKDVEQLFTQLKGTMGRNHRLDAIDELAVAKIFLHYADVGVRARAIREAHGDISILPLDQQIDGHDLRDVAPVLKGMLVSESERGKLEAARNKIRNRFTSDMNKLGLTSSNWSRESDSWIYQGVAERRFYYRDSKKALDQKAPPAEADPLEEGKESAHELELVGDTRLGWEARAQSWKLVDRGHELKYQFDSRPVLDKLNKSDSSYPEIEGLLKRSYKVFDVAATDITRNTLQLIKKNFSKAELQRLGELIRKNLDFDGERAKEEAGQKNKKEKNKEEVIEKKNPWEGAKFYQKGDQIIYRRPTGEWSTGELIDDPEELSRNRKKFKVKNTEIDPATGVSDGRVEEYTADTPPRFYEPIPDGGSVYVGGKEYTRARHMGDNRVEFDLEEVGGDGKILNVDSEVVRAAMEAHRLAQAIDKHVENLRARIEQGVATRSKDVGGKLAELSMRSKEIEKIFGTASKVSKLLPERVEEIQARIAEIQKEFSSSVGQLSAEIAGIQEKSQEVRDKAGKKLEVDRVEKAIVDRLRQLDTLTIAREGGMGRLDEWKEKKKKYDDWVKGEKKGPPVIDPGEPPFRLPSETQKDRNKVYAEVLEGLQSGSLFARELDKRIRDQFGDDLSGLLADTSLTKDIDQKQAELKKQERERNKLLKQKSQVDNDGRIDVQGTLDQITQGESEAARITAELAQFNQDRARLDAELQQLRINKEFFSQPAPDVSEIERRLNDIETQLQEKNNQLRQLNSQAQVARPQNQRGRQEQGRQGLDALAGLVTVTTVTDTIRRLEKNKDIAQEELGWAQLRANPNQLLANMDTEMGAKEQELQTLVKTIAEHQRELQGHQKQVDKGRKLLGMGNKPSAAAVGSWQDFLNNLTVKNTEIGAAKAALDQLRRQSDDLMQRRHQEVRTMVAQKIIEEWKAIKVEVPPVSIPEQQQEVRTKVDDLDKKIAGLPVSDRVKRDLRSRLTALAEKIENLPRDQHAAEQALAEMWANEIRTLEVDVYAQDLHAKPEAKERYEKSEGRVELSSALIADLLRGRERALSPVINAIFDTTLTAEDYTPEGSGETFRRVKLDKKSADRMGEIFDGAKPPDSTTLSRCGIRNWDEFRRDWKEIYAPQVVMHLQESARVMIDLRLQRDGVEEPEQKEEKKSLLRKGGRFNPINWFSKKPDPEEFKHAQEAYNNKRAEVLRELKNIPLTKLADQLGMWIGGAMASINTEFRIHNAQSQAERAGILALTGLPEEDRLNLRQQGSYLMSPGEGGEAYRLWRTYDAEDMIIVKDLEASEYTRAEEGVQAIIAAGREYLGVLHASRTRPQSEWASYDSRLSAAQKALARLEPAVESLKKILNHDPSLDRSLVAMGNSHQMLRDQIASILNEARQYIPVEAAALSMEEKEVLGVKTKMEKMVAKIDQGTSDAAAHDTTGVAENVRADMAAGSGDEDGRDDQGGGQKKGRSVIKGKLNWLIAGVFGLATTAGILSVQVVEKINKPAQQERKATQQADSSKDQSPNFLFKLESGSFKASKNGMRADYGDMKNDNRLPENPIVSFHRDYAIEETAKFLLSKKFKDTSKALDQALTEVAMNNTGVDTEAGKKKKEKLLADLGRGYQKLGWMVQLDGFPREKYKDKFDAIVVATMSKEANKNQNIITLLTRLAKDTSVTAEEANNEKKLHTRDPASGLLLYASEKSTSSLRLTKAQNEAILHEAEGHMKDLFFDVAASEKYTRQTPTLAENIRKRDFEKVRDEIKHQPVDFNTYNDLIKEARATYFPTKTAEDASSIDNLLKALVQRESSFHTQDLSPAYCSGLGQTYVGVSLDHGNGLNAFIPEVGMLQAAGELADRAQEFGGDLNLALIAYNWGSGKLRKVIEKPGHNLSTDIPFTVREYVYQVRWLHEWYKKNGFEKKAPDPPKLPKEQPAPPLVASR